MVFPMRLYAARTAGWLAASLHAEAGTSPPPRPVKTALRLRKLDVARQSSPVEVDK